jgi:hypothetical protein
VAQSDAKTVRITITLKQDIYDEVKRICQEYGLRPSTWMTMVVSSKVNSHVRESQGESGESVRVDAD